MENDHRRVIACIDITRICLLFEIWLHFQYVKTMMSDVENISNNDEFFSDAADISKEGVRQDGKREYSNV